jgi:hypothetical protein
MGYGLGCRGLNPCWGKIFSVLHSVQTRSGVHPASYPMGTGSGGFPGVKRPGREADYCSTSTAKIKNAGAIALHGMALNCCN